jgi:hypothetical protein
MEWIQQKKTEILQTALTPLELEELTISMITEKEMKRKYYKTLLYSNLSEITPVIKTHPQFFSEKSDEARINFGNRVFVH